MAVEIRFTDNSADEIRRVGNAIDNALFDMGATCQGYAVDGTPVRTGRLAGSWGFETYSDYVKIGARSAAFDDEHYAGYVENGTSRQPARHMLRNAVRDHVGEYRSIAVKWLRNR